MKRTKNWVLGEVRTGSIDKPFVLHWAVKGKPAVISSAEGAPFSITTVEMDKAISTTDIAADTAICGSPVEADSPIGSIDVDTDSAMWVTPVASDTAVAGTDIYADTAILSTPVIPDICISDTSDAVGGRFGDGEMVGTTQSGGGSGELADTTWGEI